MKRAPDYYIKSEKGYYIRGKHEVFWSWTRKIRPIKKLSTAQKYLESAKRHYPELNAVIEVIK